MRAHVYGISMRVTVSNMVVIFSTRMRAGISLWMSDIDLDMPILGVTPCHVSNDGMHRNITFDFK